MKITTVWRYEDVRIDNPRLLNLPYGVEVNSEGCITYELTVANFHHIFKEEMYREMRAGPLNYYTDYKLALEDSCTFFVELTPELKVKLDIARREKLFEVRVEANSLTVIPLDRCKRSVNPEGLARGILTYLAYGLGLRIRVGPYRQELTTRVPAYYAWFNSTEHNLATWQSLVNNDINSMNEETVELRERELNYLKHIDGYLDLKVRRMISYCRVPSPIRNPLRGENLCLCEIPCEDDRVTLDILEGNLLRPRLWVPNRFLPRLELVNGRLGITITERGLQLPNLKIVAKLKVSEKGWLLELI